MLRIQVEFSWERAKEESSVRDRLLDAEPNDTIASVHFQFRLATSQKEINNSCVLSYLNRHICAGYGQVTLATCGSTLT